jgi:collagen type I/II/III/V/XI/XXIV/XXVII alpha
MLQGIHQKLGTAGFIIAIVALVVALGGGAYAASGGLSGKQKKEVEKIAQKYAGKPGKNGATGAAGPAGAAGGKGDAGAKGDQGVAGNPGSPGEPGKEGKQGKEGRSGFTETLPAGKTETGSWAVGETAVGDTSNVFAPISFAIPLAAGLGAAQVHYVATGETAPAGCTGGTSEIPTAEPGNLCIYATSNPFLGFLAIDKSGASGAGAEGASPTGAVLAFSGVEESAAYGTFAVTEEEA